MARRAGGEASYAIIYERAFVSESIGQIAPIMSEITPNEMQMELSLRPLPCLSEHGKHMFTRSKYTAL